MSHERSSTLSDPERLESFKAASIKFEQHKTISYEVLWQKERLSLGPIVKQFGVVKFILNENFALIQGPSDSTSKNYCLFDTYDLMVGNGVSAADKDMSVLQVS